MVTINRLVDVFRSRISCIIQISVTISDGRVQNSTVGINIDFSGLTVV